MQTEPSWRECRPYFISDVDAVELMKLGKVEGEELPNTDRWQHMASVMRAECPVPGTDWHKLFAVRVLAGDAVPEHSHTEHTMLLYPEACEPILIDGTLFYPEKGTILYLPPRTQHSVPTVAADRLSIPMLVKDA